MNPFICCKLSNDVFQFLADLYLDKYEKKELDEKGKHLEWFAKISFHVINGRWSKWFVHHLFYVNNIK